MTPATPFASPSAFSDGWRFPSMARVTRSSLTVSIGIAFSGNAGARGQDVFRDAEIAMYRAKSTGKARCEVFDNAMHANAIKRLQLETDLRKALELKEFRVHYQPIVSLQNDQIVGFEALSRWQRPRAWSCLGEFIAVADEIGLILPINRQLLHDACRQLRSWHGLFPSRSAAHSSNVNITPKQFAQPDLASQIGKILQQTGIDPSCVEPGDHRNIAMADAARSAVVLSRVEGPGCSSRHRRLRHRLLLAEPSAALSGRHAKDRPRFHLTHGHGC